MRLMTARCLVFASSFSSSGAVWVADLLNLKAAQKKTPEVCTLFAEHPSHVLTGFTCEADFGEKHSRKEMFWGDEEL